MSHKKYFKIVFALVLIILLVFSFFTICFAHPGNTDSKGGHRDIKNNSGLGNYHYHCGGNPAHLHKNDICSYSQMQPTTNKIQTVKPHTALPIKPEETTQKEDNISFFQNCSSIDLIIETVPTVSFFGKSYYSLTDPIYFTVVTHESFSSDSPIQISVQNGSLTGNNTVNPLTPGPLVISIENDGLMSMKVLDIVNFPLLQLQISLIFIIGTTLLCYSVLCICRLIIKRQVKKRLCSL